MQIARRRTLCVVFLMAACCFRAEDILAGDGISTLPVLSNIASEEEGPNQQKAETVVGEEQEEGDLEFLNKDLNEISQTLVNSPTLNTEVESVSRTSQPLARTPAAVYVVTNEMIRRCGARNIPEVLRTVPGVEVARINASAWAISIRGFNKRFSNKLLVQIDGVAVYNPEHGGVYWDREYVMLEDVDRIEVIRGPGGVIWGNNAMNGIINIVTKAAKGTRGVYVDVGGGNEHRQFSDLRVGGQTGNLQWRLYGMNMDDDHGYVPSPEIAIDGTYFGQGGFRVDWTPTCCDTITVQGDFYDGHVGWDGWVLPGQFAPSTASKQTTMLTRWVREIDDSHDWALQLYYFNPNSVTTGQIWDSRRNVSTFDLDFQYHWQQGRHDIVWGFGYRNYQEHLWYNPFVAPGDSEQIPSYFVQDTITLVDERLFATFGSKFDNNSVTNFEFQPMAKVAWTPDDRTSIWGAISRVVRTPALIERFVETPRSEDMLAYEAGIRRQPNERFYWELAVFFNRYNDLLGYQGVSPYSTRQNVGDADTYGFEYNMTYEFTPQWHVNGSYSFLIEAMEFPAGYTPNDLEGSSPRNQFYFQSGWDLGREMSFDLMLRYVDSLAIGVNSYFVGDVRVAWQATKNLNMAVVGQNLFDGGHYEFVDTIYSRATEVEPGIYGMVSWRH